MTRQHSRRKGLSKEGQPLRADPEGHWPLYCGIGGMVQIEVSAELTIAPQAAVPSLALGPSREQRKLVPAGSRTLPTPVVLAGRLSSPACWLRAFKLGLAAPLHLPSPHCLAREAEPPRMLCFQIHFTS